MRINKFIAQATGLSRRAADQAIDEKRVTVNGRPVSPGTDTDPGDEIRLDGRTLALPDQTLIIMLNKPAGYVCSRAGQGSKTVYDLLPPGLERLKPVGRLDKDSSGLLLLTDDGNLANELTHPRYGKEKVYEVLLERSLSTEDRREVERGVPLEDGPSKLLIRDLRGENLTVVMRGGRNRQIRRTFAALGYRVRRLHRTRFGQYELGDLKSGAFARDPK